MIQILHLIKQENVSEAHEEKRGRGAIPEARHNTDSENAEDGEVYIHPVAGPRSDPFKAEIRKVKGWIDVVACNPSLGEVTPHFPEHKGAEDETKVNEKGIIDRFEERSHRRICRLGGEPSRPKTR